VTELNPAGFFADVERSPVSLRSLADSLDAGELPVRGLRREWRQVLFLGMGSSTYAAGVVAARLRANSVAAVAELASSELLPPPDPDLLVVAVSASGGSAETVGSVQRYVGRSTVVAVTEALGSAVTEGADVVLPLLAGPEPGGVACRSYRHTLAVLLALAEHLSPGTATDLAESVRGAAAATDDLLDRRERWLPEVAAALDGPAGSWVVAPAARLASAQQSALMLREGPRRPSHACETGDWSHVDVYLTKTLDYRMLLLPGSPWDPELLRWTADRGTTVVTVGAGAVTYPGSGQRDVALLAETTIAELVAHRWWAAQQANQP
jgi:glutamine---fructose-6-phosphate transaminase (isomerizing)